ncbi:hypothetical protein JCM19000A_35540 [Silvimonas sp. JCM 19000]
MPDISALLDIEHVRQLAGRYVACTDRGWRPGAVEPVECGSVGAGDASCDMHDLGSRVGGLEAIQASLVEETRHIDFSLDPWPVRPHG